MPRRLANGLTLLSAVVCVASALLVGRSFVWLDTAGVDRGGSSYNSYTIDGRITVTRHRSRNVGRGSYLYSYPVAGYRRGLGTSMRETTGVTWLLAWHVNSREDFYLVLPLWLLPLLTAIAPVVWWRKRRREAGRGFPVEQPGAATAD